MNHNTLKTISSNIKEHASSLGFDGCGFSRADLLSEERDRLIEWLAKGYQAGMGYMEKNLEKRTDPRKLVDNARSVVSVIYNYYPEKQPLNPDAPKIARYAYGKDYHDVIRKKLKILYTYIEDQLGVLSGRIFVDSAPVLDRAWAARSGLGWIGKNSMLISRRYGSFIFIGEIIIDKELAYDTPINDYCGDCTRCLDACPTAALVSPGVLNANLCISYQTIENRNTISPALKGKMGNWVFGCDICQEVCPWNLRKVTHGEPEFEPNEKIMNLTREEWGKMSEDDYREWFRCSAVKRAKYSGLRRNLDFLG